MISGDLASSLADFNEAIKINPEHIYANHYKAMCLLHMHQYKQALTYYEKALELIEQEKLKGEGGSIRKQAAESLTNTINRDIKFCNSLIAKEKT